MKRYLFVLAMLGLVVLVILPFTGCARSRTASAMSSTSEEGQPAAALAQKVQAAQGQASVVIAPSVSTVAVGATTVVEVQVQNVQNLFGADIRLSFDPSKLEVQDANPGMAGVQIEPGPFLDVNQGFVAQNSADNTAGRINYAMTLLGQAQPASGSGTIMRITFKGLAAGESAVSFLSALLSDRVGNQIAATTQGGTVRVGEAGPTPTGQPGPTETAQPGPTATGQPGPTATTQPGPTATGQPTPTATKQPGPAKTPVPGTTCTYIVKRGDTLSSLAVRFGTTTSAIAAANGLRNRNFIYTGQRLKIPGSNCQGTTPPPPPPPTGCVTYVVKPGDTLSGIAARYGTTSYAIAARNGLPNRNFIFSGQRLIVCGQTGTVPPPAGRFHVVQRGDTLIGLALKYGTTVRAIMAANGIVNPDLIFVGRRLRIP